MICSNNIIFLTLCLSCNRLQYESIPGEKGPVVRPIIQTAGSITRKVLESLFGLSRNTYTHASREALRSERSK